MMHTIAAKFGALAFAPLMFFGAHMGATTHAPSLPSATTNASYSAQANADWFHWPWHTGTTTPPSHTRAAPLAIASIDGPTTLGTGTVGTWTVNVDSDATTTLHYSVKWGDEVAQPLALVRSANQSQLSATFTHEYDADGTYTPAFTVSDDNGNTVTQDASAVAVATPSPVQISSITPATGPVGTSVTLAGTDFTASSTVSVGGTAATDVVPSADGTSLTFTVPSVDTGKQDVSVTNADGTSNVVTFKVTKPVPVHISVNGIDAPATLTVGADGTWTVHASTNSDSNLQYSVVWGDEGASPMISALARPSTTQASATFTHEYDAKGTYTPKFTVSDGNGHSASVSATVVVKAAKK